MLVKRKESYKDLHRRNGAAEKRSDYEGRRDEICGRRRKSSCKHGKIETGIKKYGIKVNAVGVFTTATCAMIKYNSRNAYTKRIRKGSQGWFNVVYGATKADRKFADKLCQVISLNGVLTFIKDRMCEECQL